MRILTGKYKGRRIKMPGGLRPTQDKVRKALFDILGGLEGLSFLELFSGTGAVGIEALSQGAKEAIFVENNRSCLRILEDNLSSLAPDAQHPTPVAYHLLPMDSSLAIRKLAKKRFRFDIIFMDPPYYQDIAKKTLQILGAYDILAPNGFIVVQHFKKENLPAELGDLTLFKQSRYGDTALSFYRKK